MPIHLIWGDDEAARSRAIESMVNSRVGRLTERRTHQPFGTKANRTSQEFKEMQALQFDKRHSAFALVMYPDFNKCPKCLAEQLGPLRA